MNKELEASLRERQTHPTTGLPHNQQVISTQVETVFALDSLQQEVVKLRKTIETANSQSEKLERSNYRLQVAMLVLTAMSTGVILFPFFRGLINSIYPWLSMSLNKLGAIHLSEIFITIISVLLSLVSALVTFFAEKKIVKKITINLQDDVKVNDSFSAVLRDKNGEIKDVRHS